MTLKEKWRNLSHLGVDAADTASLKRKIILSNQLSFVGVIGLSTFVFLWMFKGRIELSLTLLIYSAFIGSALYFNAKRLITLSRVLLMFGSSLFLCFFFYILGEPSGLTFYYVPHFACVFIIFDFREKKSIVLMALASISACSLNLFYPNLMFNDIRLPEDVASIIYVPNFITAIGYMIAVLYFSLRIHYIDEQTLLKNLRELRGTKKSLETAQHKMQQAMDQKSQFFSNISHEIRTPMNAVIGLTDYMLTTEEIHGENRERLELIRKASNNLLAIINDVLDMSTIESGKFSLNPTPVRLHEIIANISGYMSLRATNKGLDFVTDFEGLNTPCIEADPVRLEQVLVNVLENAIKFTSKGNVTFTVSQQQLAHRFVQIKFEISDTGLGISEDHLETIFESYARINEKVADPEKGAGLGLAIAKQIVENMGGTIAVTSKIGEGSTFSIDIEFKELDVPERVEFKQPQEQLDFKNMKVLLVEDNEMNQMVIKQFSDLWNIDLDVSDDGIDAVSKCNECEYDLILMDLHMPRMTGYEASEIIRNEGLNQNSTIIGFSADVFPETKIKVAKSGMNGFINKPVLKDELSDLFSTYQPQN